MSKEKNKQMKMKEPILLDAKDMQDFGLVDTDGDDNQERIVDDKLAYAIALTNQMRIVINAMDSSEDVGVSAMLHLITMSLPAVGDKYEAYLREDRNRFRDYMRDEVHLSVPLAGYAIPGERTIRSVEEGQRCREAYWHLQNNPNLPFYNKVEYDRYKDDAGLWRRMMNNPVSMRKSTWLAKLRAEVDDELDILLLILHQAGLLLHTRRNEPAGGEP